MARAVGELVGTRRRRPRGADVLDRHRHRHRRQQGARRAGRPGVGPVDRPGCPAVERRQRAHPESQAAASGARGRVRRRVPRHHHPDPDEAAAIALLRSIDDDRADADGAGSGTSRLGKVAGVPAAIEVARPPQVLRRRRRRARRLVHASTPARSSPCSDRTAPARRPRSRCSRASAPRRRAGAGPRHRSGHRRQRVPRPHRDRAAGVRHRPATSPSPRCCACTRRTTRTRARWTRPSSSSGSTRSATRGSRRCRAVSNADSTSGSASSATPSCCSSTSRRPGSIRRPAARRGTSCTGSASLGKTVLLTTHYMEEAQALADRLVVIAAGRIIAEGTPDAIGGRAEAAQHHPLPLAGRRARSTTCRSPPRATAPTRVDPDPRRHHHPAVAHRVGRDPRRRPRRGSPSPGRRWRTCTSTSSASDVVSAGRTFARQVGWEQRSFWRNPSSAAFTFAFPLLFLVVFIAINGNDKVHLPGGTGAVRAVLRAGDRGVRPHQRVVHEPRVHAVDPAGQRPAEAGPRHAAAARRCTSPAWAATSWSSA